MRSNWSKLEQVPEALDSSGAFETCRVRRGKPLFLQEHLIRLEASLKTLGIFSWDKKRAGREILQAACSVKEGYVRIAVGRSARTPWILHAQKGVPYSSKQRERGISVVTAPTRWPSGETGFAQAKGSQRMSGILARLEGPEASEALRIGPHGYLTEGTVSNLFMVKSNAIWTPPHWLGVLEGVTRARVMEAALHLRIPVIEVPLTRHELFNAEEAFLTNVLMDILPIREVDGRRIGLRIPGRLTRRLMRALK